MNFIIIFWSSNMVVTMEHILPHPKRETVSVTTQCKISMHIHIYIYIYIYIYTYIHTTERKFQEIILILT